MNCLASFLIRVVFTQACTRTDLGLCDNMQVHEDLFFDMKHASFSVSTFYV